MATENRTQSNALNSRSPYKEAFDIDYPQQAVEGQMHVYVCKSCKLLTTVINGRLENHQPDCAYRLQREGNADQ